MFRFLNSAMNVLRKICLQEENQEFVCTALDVQTYEALVTVLVLEDVQVTHEEPCLECFWKYCTVHVQYSLHQNS